MVSLISQLGLAGRLQTPLHSNFLDGFQRLNKHFSASGFINGDALASMPLEVLKTARAIVVKRGLGIVW